MLKQKHLILCIFITDHTKRSNKMTKRIAGITRPTVYVYDDSLLFKRFGLTRFNANFGYTFLRWKKQVTRSIWKIAHLKYATIWTPVTLYDANYTT